MSRRQNAGQNRNIEYSPWNCGEVQIFGNDRLNSGNACNHSVQNLLPSCLLSETVEIIIYKSVTVPVVLYGCETWSLKLREEYALRIFENRVLKRISVPKMYEIIGGWRKMHNEELHNLFKFKY
jgi:hypothetical protein